MGAVGQREHEVAPSAGARPLQERRDDLRHRPEPAGQIGDLHRRHRGSRVLEEPRPALVVEVVAGSEVARAEAGEGAVDDAIRQVGGPDSQPLHDAGAEALEHDVGPGAELTARRRVGLQVELDRLLAGVQRLVPGRREHAERVAARGLEPYHPRAEPHELTAREWSRQVARQVDDQQARERFHQPRLLHSGGVPNRSNAQEEKRRLLLDAAVRVFARKGYHASRVGDIAEEAGVAYGLLYHYFDSKEDVLRAVFREMWRALIETIKSVEEAGDPPREQLRKVAEILLRSWRRDPDLVRVLVLEVTRSPHLRDEMDEIEESFAAIQEIVERGQADGSIRSDLDPQLASYVFFGAVEELLTGWVLGRLPDSDEDVARAERTLVEIVTGGLAHELATTRT
jgi:TetR/AcrR family transcriptional regulator, fatty acid metabolism regulator protein